MMDRHSLMFGKMRPADPAMGQPQRRGTEVLHAIPTARLDSGTLFEMEHLGGTYVFVSGMWSSVLLIMLRETSSTAQVGTDLAEARADG